MKRPLKNQLQRKNKVTNSKCTYCGEHHHYQHELVCDNVRQLYPLPLITDGEAVRLVEDYLSNEAKALRGDLIHKNTEFLEERAKRLMAESRLDLALREVKSLKVQLLTQSRQESNQPM